MEHAMSWWLNVSRTDWLAAVERELPRMQQTKEGQAVYLTTWQAQQAKEAAMGKDHSRDGRSGAKGHQSHWAVRT